MTPIKITLLLALSITAIHGQTYTTAPSTLLHLRCNTSHKLPTPTYGNQNIIFSVCAETSIHAPIAKIYTALLDFSAYSTWNTFTISVQPRGDSSLLPAPAAVGTQMRFTTAGLLPFNTTSDEIVSIAIPDVDGSGKFAFNGWKTDSFGGNAEHGNILTELGDGWTRVVSYESFYVGVTGAAVVLKERLRERFERQGEDLKGYVEGME